MGWLPLSGTTRRRRGYTDVEVGRYDQVTGLRFRHGTGFPRWRPDKDPKQCTFEQLAPELRRSELKELFAV